MGAGVGDGEGGLIKTIEVPRTLRVRDISSAHLGAVIATMKLSNDWHDFKAKLDKNYPRQGKPTQLSFDYAKEEEAASGMGL